MHPRALRIAMTSTPGRSSTLRFIAGAGRSGTTWVLDALAEANNLRPIFEPLDPETSEVGRRYAHAYLTRSTDSTELLDMFTAAANGILKSTWTDYRIKSDKLRLNAEALRSMSGLHRYLHRWKRLAGLFVANRPVMRRADTLVKCIRANLMLDWIRGHMDAQIAFLIRHPGAVVESRLRLSDRWDPSSLLAKYRDDEALCSGALEEFEPALQRPQTSAEALTTIWCIENLVPAAQAARNGYEVVFYEELLERPETEWRRLADGLQLNCVPATELLARPSQQAAVNWKRGGAGESDFANNHAKWQTRLNDAELRQIDMTLNAFHVDFYSVSEPRPDVDAFTRRFGRPMK